MRKVCSLSLFRPYDRLIECSTQAQVPTPARRGLPLKIGSAEKLPNKLMGGKSDQSPILPEIF
jgi:hypothetical protein